MAAGLTVDTTVTNGRLIEPSGVRDASLTVHKGAVQSSVELEDVWRTVNASGLLVWPGLIQFGATDPGSSLELARNGITTVIASKTDGACLDHVPVQDSSSEIGDSCRRVLSISGNDGVPNVSEPDSVAVVRVPASLVEDMKRWESVSPVVIVESLDGWRAAKTVNAAAIEIPVDALQTDEALWNLVANAELNVHVTNHDSYQFSILPFLYHEGHTKRDIQLPRLAAVTSANPASIYGIAPAKGWIETGSDGDLLVFDPDSEDPYREHEWAGRVIFSLQRGNILFHTGQLHAPPGAGRNLYSP